MTYTTVVISYPTIIMTYPTVATTLRTFSLVQYCMSRFCLNISNWYHDSPNSYYVKFTCCILKYIPCNSHTYLTIQWNQLVKSICYMAYPTAFMTAMQGWEFAHRFFEQITRFLPKNERMSDSLNKMSDSLICSFLVSDLSDSLTIAHLL